MHRSVVGTRPNAQNFQLLVSTGIASFDKILGDGIPLGSVCLLEESSHCTYSKIMLKYFLAEGVVCRHALFVASLDVPSKELITLPKPIEKEHEEIKRLDQNKLNIAFRYEHLPAKPEAKSTFSHSFDLSTSIDLDPTLDVTVWDERDKPNCAFRFKNPAYQNLLNSIADKIKTYGYHNEAKPTKRNVLRVALHALGSPFWQETDGENDLNLFLLLLRSIVRSTYCVVFVTVPKWTDLNSSRLSNNVDTLIELEAFEKEKHPALCDYTGFFRIVRLPTINTIASHVPETYDLAFKLRRRKFEIEPIHLPPDLSEKDDDMVTGRLSCASTSSSTFEF